MTLTECLQTPPEAPSACFAHLWNQSGIVVQDAHGACFFLYGPAYERAFRITPADFPFVSTKVGPVRDRSARLVLDEAVRRVCGIARPDHRQQVFTFVSVA